MDEKIEKTKLSNKQNKAPSKKNDTVVLEERIEKLTSSVEKLSEDLALCIKVNQIVIGLLGGISPGRKNLDSIDIMKLRNQGVKVKDLAKMQGISECAMHRQLKAMKEAGLYVLDAE